MKSMLFTDTMTGRKSLTVTLLIWSFVLYLATVVAYLAGAGNLKITMIALFGVGIFFAGYRQKRLKLSFSGVEIEHDKGVCDVGIGKTD